MIRRSKRQAVWTPDCQGETVLEDENEGRIGHLHRRSVGPHAPHAACRNGQQRNQFAFLSGSAWKAPSMISSAVAPRRRISMRTSSATSIICPLAAWAIARTKPCCAARATASKPRGWGVCGILKVAAKPSTAAVRLAKAEAQS
jgi:hypothetical protein